MRIKITAVSAICLGCGKTFFPKPCDVKRRGAKYCGRQCSDRFHARPGSFVGVRGSKEERFWRKVDKTPGQGPLGECWQWTGATNADGVGTFRENPGKGTLTRATRFAWLISHGPIPKGLNVVQECGNRRCVRCLRLGKKYGDIAAKNAKRLRLEKSCKKCGAVKPITEYGPLKRAADGRAYQCRECAQQAANTRYALDPAKDRARSVKWQRAHREVGRAIAQQRRATKRGLPGSHTLKEWQELCRKFKGQCVRCGKETKLTRDHVIPITAPNSSHDISNIQPLCYSCNSSKGNRHSTDYRKTPFVNQGQVVMF